MENKEKVEFILYQMKLVLLRQDYVRLQILSKKISKKAIAEPGLEACKILYYKYLVRYYIQEKDMLNTSKSYQTIYDTLNKATSDPVLINALDQNGSERLVNFQNFVIYLLISPYTNEKIDLLNIVEAMYPRELEQENLIGKLVRKLLTYELMPLNEQEIEQSMSKFEPFQESTKNNKAHMRELIK